ncbi:MAG: acetyl-CoA hydrolase/transferase family protein [Candidatus Binatia bacterium]
MQLVSPHVAVRSIPDGSRAILPHGCVEPTAFYEALQTERARFRNLRLYSGLQFGDYPFLRAGLGENFTYTTWQASAKLRSLFKEGRAEVLPLRFRDVTRVVARNGPVPPDVVVVQVSKPDNGFVNLGISVSLYRDFIANARLVIAEINTHMPPTHGNTRVALSDIHLGFESEHPLGEYRAPRRTARDERIVERVLSLIPRGAWVQFGVGAIPDAVLCRLHEVPDANIHSGMLTDGLIDFVEKSRHRARVVTGEVAGTAVLYAFVGRTPQVEFHPSSVTHDFIPIAKLPGFVSVNSAIEVDLHGQVNGETIDGVQISGVGGSLDFVEGAAASPGGMAIIALPSTTENGARSKIVRQLAAHTPVTIPRFCADVVVTEHGIAQLKGKTLRERADALRVIAHPDFQATL